MSKYQICVSGAASGRTVEASHELAARLGAAVAKEGQILLTGATIGLPFYAARAAKKAKGMSVGFSPAASTREHVYKCRLPLEGFDFIIFTGMAYAGRDLHMIHSSDAVVFVGGRVGTLQEFTTTLEAGKPCGVLIGSGGTADLIPDLMSILEPPHKRLVIYDDNPERLVKRIVDLLDEEFSDIEHKDSGRKTTKKVTNRRG